MKVSEMCGVGSSSAAKGFKRDRQQREIIKRRETKRRDIEDVNQFMATLAAICPNYYGDKNDV